MQVTRRHLLRSAGGVGIAAAAGVTAARLSPGSPSPTATAPGEAVPFFGEHQAGIATPSQEHLQFAALDFLGDSPEDLRTLLITLTAAAAAIARGDPVGPLEDGALPPVDTGEAAGLPVARATVTLGLGPRIFQQSGADQLGLSALRPPPLVELPAFAGDALDPALCGGDLALQVCAEDPQVAFHAIHDLIRLAAGIATPRWLLAGFGRTANSRHQQTPRNLLGFKDGTANITAEDTPALNKFVWARGPESPPWMHGGSYMVVRRIRMLLGAWDATNISQQEATFGRHKLTGAPLGSRREHDPINLAATADGLPVIPADAHIRQAHPDYNHGQRILRRGYGYLDGIDPATQTISGGLLFITYQRDPRIQFIPIQQRLSQNDALNQHIQHVGSAIFACPPGCTPGGFIGQQLLQ